MMSPRVGNGGRHNGGRKNLVCSFGAKMDLTMTTMLKVTPASEQYIARLRISTHHPPRESMTCDDHFGDNAKVDKGRPCTVGALILIVGIEGDFHQGKGTLVQL